MEYRSHNRKKHSRGYPSNVRGERGVSLIELIIYIALVSVIIIVIANAFISIGQSGSTVQARTDVHSNIRFAVDKIVRDIKAASLVATPPTLGATSTTLSLTVSGDTIVYDVQSGQLRRTVNAAAPDPVTSTLVVVSVPIFTRVENYNTILAATTTSIRVNMTISYNGAGPAYSYTDSINTVASLW